MTSRPGDENTVTFSNEAETTENLKEDKDDQELENKEEQKRTDGDEVA